MQPFRAASVVEIFMKEDIVSNDRIKGETYSWVRPMLASSRICGGC